MITLLVNKSQDDVGVSVLKEGAVNLVSAVFNILMSASYNADFRRNHLTQVADQNKVRSFAQKSRVQCSTVQCSAVQYSAVECSAVQYSAIQCITVQYSTMQCSAINVSKTPIIESRYLHIPYSLNAALGLGGLLFQLDIVSAVSTKDLK